MENIQNFKELMFLKNFSQRTIKNYISTILNVSKKINKNPSDVSELDLRGYILKNKQYSSSTRTNIINAFKSFYILCFNKDFDSKILPRPKVEQKQPDILSTEEIQLLINSILNLKHKTIVCLMYSCGLRVGECTALKIKDIDSNLNKISIKNGKGKIDRIVMLDKSILELLRKYWMEYQTKEYLFEGAKGGKYSDKSIQTLVKKAVIKCNIKKKISSHSLRHSCLTQLVKNGTDLRTVQKIAGHKNINTTAGYIKLIDSDILETISPISSIKI